MNYRFYNPTKVHFGPGKLEELGQLAISYGKTCLMVTTENTFPLNALYDRVKSILTQVGIQVYHFDQVKPNPSVEIVENGIEYLKACQADFVLAVGGGSSIDTAKSIALLSEAKLDWPYIFSTYTSPFEDYPSLGKMPLIAVPTTAGTGSEVTQAAVLSQGDEKLTIFHQDNYSSEAILDPELLLTLPQRLTAATGFDAFCHAFESYISSNASDMSDMYALEAMRTVIDVLPKAIKDPKNISYRTRLMKAQYLAGVALANGGAHAPHPLSEIIGGITHMSHGEALALVFPEFVEAVYDQHQERFDRVADIFGKPLKEGILSLLMAIDLYKTKADYQVTDDQVKSIVNHPVLGFLPFANKATLKNILERSFDR